MLSEGTVREWSDDCGWGVIDSAETPGGCWAHFSVIVTHGYRSLEPGGQVAFTYDVPGQDGVGYRAVQVAARRESGSTATGGQPRAVGRVPQLAYCPVAGREHYQGRTRPQAGQLGSQHRIPP